jgi:hypothetical protein
MNHGAHNPDNVPTLNSTSKNLDVLGHQYLSLCIDSALYITFFVILHFYFPDSFIAF